MAVTSPAMRTSFGTMRTIPSGAVSSGTVRKKGPFTLEITVGSVATESIRARLFSGPMTRAMLGVMDRPRMTYPDSASTRTRGTMRTSLCTTESSRPPIPRGRSSLTQEPPDEGFVDGSVPLGGPDHLLDDDAVGADHPALGDARGLVGPLHRPRLVVQDVEREPQVAGERGNDGITVLVDAHRHHPEAAAAELARQALERRHLDPARQAPRRPEIQEHHLPAIVRERRGAPGGQVLGVKVRRARSDAEQVDLGTDLDRQGRPEHDGHGDPDRERPAPGVAHTVTRQRCFRSRTSRAGSGLPKTAFPTTNVSAPAACAAAMVCEVMPPSTSRNARDPFVVSSSRARRILSFEEARYDWPLNPGFTVITSSRSRSAITASARARGDPGLSARPASIPRLRAAASWRCTCTVASGWNVNTDAPAAANGSR